ncbi:MAG: BACON domain-containing protein [Bacteroidaceae bacterium]|nr:BACON domain-containing protein [Bacteroidaceae bacterium]
MKKTFYLMAMAVLMLAACSGKDNGAHSLAVLTPNRILFADATWDSIWFETTDKPSFSSDSWWCQPSPTYVRDIANTTFHENSIYTLALPVDIEANTTGKVRTAILTFKTSEFTVTTAVRQLATLNIIRPARFYLDEYLSDTLTSLTDSAYVTLDSVSFRVAGNWTLTAKEDSWIHPEKLQGMAGQHVVKVNLLPNTTGDQRRDTLWLTSTVEVTKQDGTTSTMAVKDFIPFLQLKPKTH